MLKLFRSGFDLAFDRFIEGVKRLRSPSLLVLQESDGLRKRSTYPTTISLFGIALGSARCFA
jgi:hypothetical protein